VNVQIELLGAFRVTVGTRPVPEDAWRRRKPAALVKLLALAPGHRLPRERVMEALWPELEPHAAAANLRKALHQARRALGDEGGAAIVSLGDVLFLPQGSLSVDVDSFFAEIAAARRTGDAAAYERALALYGDGLLPDDRYADWSRERRDELAAEFVTAAEELAALLEAQGDLDGAIRVVRRLVAADPLRERAHLALMRLHALAGRREEALHAYEHLRDVLARELAAEPTAEAQRLYEEVRADRSDPELSAELWERVGDLRVLSGDTGGAARAFASALRHARDEPELARVHRKLATARLMGHEPDAAELHLHAAERLASDPVERAQLACLRANQAWERGDLDAARRHAETALELAEATGDDASIAGAQEALTIVLHLRGEWRAGLQLEVERVAADRDGRTQLARVFDIHHCIGQFHLYGDSLSEGVENYARRTLALAEEAHAIRAQAFAWCLLGETLLLRARWDEAAGCLERSCELHESLGTPTAALPWQRLAELAVCRGRGAEAEVYLRRAAAIATVSPMARHHWGRIHATSTLAGLERGDVDAAVRAVRAAAAATVRYGDCPTCSALLNPLAAEAFAALGDVAAAHAYALAAETVSERFDSSAWRAMAESAAASVAAAEGDAPLAVARFREAAGLYDRAEQPYWAERSLAQAAAVA
jgi:DNA-binding SARP family transcriptional activator